MAQAVRVVLVVQEVRELLRARGKTTDAIERPDPQLPRAVLMQCQDVVVAEAERVARRMPVPMRASSIL